MRVAINLLRVAVFGTFIGHGLFAITVNPSWVPYLEFWGFSSDQAENLMPIIGGLDILIGLIILIKPSKYVIMYAIAWAFLTALMRPIVGESWLAFIERAANWGAPAALYAILYLRKK